VCVCVCVCVCVSEFVYDCCDNCALSKLRYGFDDGELRCECTCIYVYIYIYYVRLCICIRDIFRHTRTRTRTHTHIHIAHRNEEQLSKEYLIQIPSLNGGPTMRDAVDICNSGQLVKILVKNGAKIGLPQPYYVGDSWTSKGMLRIRGEMSVEGCNRDMSSASGGGQSFGYGHNKTASQQTSEVHSVDDAYRRGEGDDPRIKAAAKHAPGIDNLHGITSNDLHKDGHTKSSVEHAPMIHSMWFLSDDSAGCIRGIECQWEAVGVDLKDDMHAATLNAEEQERDVQEAMATTDRLIEELENEQHDGVDEVCVRVFVCFLCLDICMSGLRGMCRSLWLLLPIG
jgi:hypothetical protein